MPSDRALYGLLRWINNQNWNHVLRQHQKQQIKKKKLNPDLPNITVCVIIDT
jgi:hypothetical protein